MARASAAAQTERDGDGEDHGLVAKNALYRCLDKLLPDKAALFFCICGRAGRLCSRRTRNQIAWNLGRLPTRQ
jgi:hypothetical protein